MIGSNAIISTKRLVSNSESKSSYDTFILENIEAYIQPQRATLMPIFDGQNAYQIFDIICEGKLDIRRSDKIINNNDGREFVVRDVESYSDNTDTGDMTEMSCTLRYPES